MVNIYLRRALFAGRISILLILGMPVILGVIYLDVKAQDDNSATSDMLAYVSDENQLMLYDPRERTETLLLENVDTFLIGRDGRIAFTTLSENDTDLYVIDPAAPDPIPVNISQSVDTSVYPLAWSPDGDYLAFVSYTLSEDYSYMWTFQGGYRVSSSDQSLYVWDGETTTNIMPEDGLDTASWFYVDWSHDGRLAFTIEYDWSNLDTPAEIYLWNGNTTTNLSQNPGGWDSGARWSRTGKLLFGSQRDEEGGIYIWDGISFKNGLPDIDSLIRLPPELEPTSATWMDDGIVAFTAYPNSSSSDMKVIMLWDPEHEVIVDQYSVASDKMHSLLAEGGQFILSSQMASGLPSVYLDVETVEGDILFDDHMGNFSWNPGGYLAFCAIDDRRNWVLSIWDGEETWEIVRTHSKPIQWQSQQYIFSCNNG